VNLNRLKELLDDHQTGMSQFQDDNLVTVRAGGTLYGQYKQALRELYKRFRGLRESTCERERLVIDIEELSEKILDCEGFEKRRAEVDYKHKVMLMEEANRAIMDTRREFTRFYQQAAYLKDQLGELTPEKRHKLDIEMWEFRIKEMAVIDWITNGRLRNSTYEFLQATPPEMKLRLVESLRDQNNTIEWYENKEKDFIPNNLPMIEPFTTETILELEITTKFEQLDK
jgi:hypothetical protein